MFHNRASKVANEPSTHEHAITLAAPPDAALALFIEPWALAYTVPAGKAAVLVATSDTPGAWEIEAGEGGTTAYAWPGATFQIQVDGEVVEEMDIAVPSGLDRKMLAMLFDTASGPTPPATAERAPWWRIWK